MIRQILYTPVLKGKANDLKALGAVSAPLASQIMPILEFIRPAKPTDLARAATRFLGQLQTHILTQRIGVDLQQLGPHDVLPNGTRLLDLVLASMQSLGLQFTPVHGFDRESELWDVVGEIARRDGRGVIFRLERDDIESPEETVSEIAALLAQAQLATTDTTLILDVRSVDAAGGIGGMSGVVQQLQDFIEEALGIGSYRGISIVGSSMPPDVSVVPKQGMGTIERYELNLWLSVAAGFPTQEIQFGDYGVVHPNFSDKNPAPHANAKIRYAHRNVHHIFRGESLQKGLKYGQYRELSRRVCAESFYRGRGYSAGDQYIFDCANGAGKTGNLGTWVYVDMNHHMTSTAIYLPRVLEQFTRGAPIERAIADTQ